MSRMKNAVILPTLASLLMSVSLVAPRPAQAVVGIATANPVLIVLGAVVTGGVGYFTVTETYPVCKAMNSGGFAALLGAIYCPILGIGSIVGGALGILALDAGQGETHYRFAALDAAQAASLGLSEAQLEAFNGELDELNAVFETMQAETSARAAHGEALSLEETHQAWLRNSSALSEGARAAAEAIARNVFEKISRS